MLSRLQYLVEGFFASSASIFNRVGVTPNGATLIGFGMIGLASIFYALGLSVLPYWTLAVIFLLLSGYFDALDGAMARRYHSVSPAGGVLDSVFDRIGELLLYSAIGVGGLVSFPLAIWALSSSFLVSYVRARAEIEEVKMKGVGIAERPERLLIVLIATILYLVYRDSVLWAVTIVAVLSTVTVVQRIYHSWRVLSKQKK